MDKKRKNDVENKVKLMEVENEAQKIKDEKADKIREYELKLKELSESHEKYKEKREYLKELNSLLKADYNKCLAMDTGDFKSPEVNQHLNDLRNYILKISMQLME